MVSAVVMPQLGLEVTEGTVVEIHVSPGSSVVRDQTLLELETDKALTEVEAPRAGVVARVEVEVGQTVHVGATLILLADSLDEEIPRTPADGADSAPQPAAILEAGGA
jgi:pyruvate/2-oxoglutarate dehydrogenase complex dihydrolipoamide acyltransferase (E2) component